MKLLLDTNAVIDHIAGREPFCHDMEQLCIASYFGDVELWVPVQSFLDGLYALRKYAPEDQLRQAFLASLEFFRPCGSRAEDLRPALESDWPDVEDCLIARAAQNIAADYLVTRDASGFAGSRVATVTPAEAVELLAQDGFEYGEVLI